MTGKSKIPSRLVEEMLALARDMHANDTMDGETFKKITLRHAGGTTASVASLTPSEVRELRRKSHMSQAVFAHHLNLTPGYVSQLERGEKRVTGPALVLLDVIRRKGIDAIL